MPRFGRVVLGGTFDRLHVGHEALLATAFREGRSVAIGVTTAGYLRRHPKPGSARIATYGARRATLVRWLSARYPRSRWTVVPLEDTFGRSVESGVDAIVLSADTLAGGRAVNAERRRRGRRAVPLVVVPLVLGDDLEPVSSRRIRAGAIDREGHRRAKIRVALGAGSEGDRRAAVRGIRRAFPRAQVGRRPPPAVRRRGGTGGVPAGGVTVTVTGSGPTRRTVTVATDRGTLSPVTATGRFPGDLARLVADVLRRPRRPKSFKRRRR